MAATVSLNAHDFPGLQAAIDALPETGGEVFIPTGVYDIPETGLRMNEDNVTLRGEGTGPIRPPAATGPMVLAVNVHVPVLRDCTFSGAAPGPGEARQGRTLQADEPVMPGQPARDRDHAKPRPGGS